MIAALLEMRFKSALLAIFLGNVMAGTIVYILTQLAVKSIRIFFRADFSAPF